MAPRKEPNEKKSKKVTKKPTKKSLPRKTLTRVEKSKKTPEETSPVKRSKRGRKPSKKIQEATSSAEVEKVEKVTTPEDEPSHILPRPRSNLYLSDWAFPRPFQNLEDPPNSDPTPLIRCIEKRGPFAEEELVYIDIESDDPSSD